MSTSNSPPYSTDSPQNSPYFPPSNGSHGYSMYHPGTPEHTLSPFNQYDTSSEMTVGRRPQLKILAEPQPKFRFRYQSEMIGTHGCLMAETNGSGNQSRKSYIRVQLEGYHGREAVIRCSLVTNEQNPQPHVHKLSGESTLGNGNSEYFDVTVSASKDDWTATFTGLTIIHTGKKQVREVLEKRLLREAWMGYSRENPGAKALPTPLERQIKDKADNLGNHMDLHCVRLKFEALATENGQLVRLCPPLYSNPIHNLKSTQAADLRIVRVDKVVSSCAGQEEVFIFVEKVNKKDIKVKFYQYNEDEDKETWSAFADFSELDVHHQYAIAFKTPPYHDQNITEDVNVYFQLYRPSNNAVSEPRCFTYKPREDITRKRRMDPSSLNGSGSGGKRLNFFPRPVPGPDGSKAGGSSSTSGNGANPSGGENTQAPAADSVMGAHPFPRQAPQPFLPYQHFSSSTSAINTQQADTWQQQGVFSYPIFTTAPPAVLERGVMQHSHQLQQQGSIVNNPPQQVAQFPECDLSYLLQEPQQHWPASSQSTIDPSRQDQWVQQPPAQLNVEQVRRDQLRQEDPFLSELLTMPADFFASLDDFVEPDAVKVQRSATVEDITNKLATASLENQQDGKETERHSLKEQMNAVDVGRLLSLNFGGALRRYAATGDLSNLLKSNLYLLALQSEDGDKYVDAVHCALLNNQMEVFYMMLNAAKNHHASRDLVNAQNDLNQTPLHFAVVMNNQKAVSALMDAGADFSLADRQGNTPVHIAAKDPSLLPCLQLLVSSCNKNASGVKSKLDLLNYDGMAPLHLAITAGCSEAVQLLIQAGANANVIEAKTGRAPLHIAIEKKLNEIINIILSCDTVDVNLRSYDGSTPLHLAVAEGLEQVCLSLRKKGADPNLKSFVNINSYGSVGGAEGESDSEDSEGRTSDPEDGEGNARSSGVTPSQLAQANSKILEILSGTYDLSPEDLVTTDSVIQTSNQKSESRILDSGIDIMTSRELNCRELDDSVIQRLSNILDSSDSDFWKCLATALAIPTTLINAASSQKSPITYILQNLEMLDVTPQAVLDKLAEMKMSEAVRVLDNYLNS